MKIPVPVVELENIFYCIGTVSVVSHGKGHTLQHEDHVLLGEGGEEQVRQLGRGQHREPGHNHDINMNFNKWEWKRARARLYACILAQA